MDTKIESVNDAATGSVTGTNQVVLEGGGLEQFCTQAANNLLTILEAEESQTARHLAPPPETPENHK